MLFRDYAQFIRTENGVHEVRGLALHEDCVWENVHLNAFSDEEIYTSSMVMEALGSHASKQWFDQRKIDLQNEGFRLLVPDKP